MYRSVLVVYIQCCTSVYMCINTTTSTYFKCRSDGLVGVAAVNKASSQGSNPHQFSFFFFDTFLAYPFLIDFLFIINSS